MTGREHEWADDTSSAFCRHCGQNRCFIDVGDACPKRPAAPAGPPHDFNPLTYRCRYCGQGQDATSTMECRARAEPPPHPVRRRDIFSRAPRPFTSDGQPT